MAIIVIDNELAQQIRDAGEKVGLVDREGKPVGAFRPIQVQPQVAYTLEYIEQRRKELEPIRRRFREHPEECKTLDEMMEKLYRLAGEMHAVDSDSRIE